MNNSLKKELTNHVINTINDLALETFEDLHHHAFNETEYVIGYFNAEKWLEEHNIDAFEAISEVIEWERDTLGEVTLKPEDFNPEKIVNLYVYVMGEELLSEFDLYQTKEELLAELEAA